jgi:hypothetical protein
MLTATPTPTRGQAGSAKALLNYDLNQKAQIENYN